MYHPLKHHSFMIDHVKPKSNHEYMQSPGIKPPSISDQSLVRTMSKIMNLKLGEFKNTRVVWDFGAGSCTGWFMEAVNFVTALENRVPLRIITGKHDMCEGLPGYLLSSLHRLIDRTFANITIFVTHKPPDRYPSFPYKGLVNIPGLPEYVIGRSMYESTSIPSNWNNHIDKVDRIWVPGHFLMDAFVNAGMSKSKVTFLPEPIDHYFYDPEIHKPLPLKHSSHFNFLSIFKWEPRKNAELMIEAFCREFENEPKVTLHLLTYLFNDYAAHDPDRIMEKVKSVSDRLDIKKLPKINIIADVIPTQDMPRIYKSADAFVLPSRGEGWGMPYMEAMTMGLPTIAPAWGGQMEFMNANNSYLIHYTLKNVNDYDQDENAEKWAEADLNDLRKKMRYVFNHKKEAKKVGAEARKSIVSRFSQKALVDMVLSEFRKVKQIIKDKSFVRVQDKKPKVIDSKVADVKDEFRKVMEKNGLVENASQDEYENFLLGMDEEKLGDLFNSVQINSGIVEKKTSKQVTTTAPPKKQIAIKINL
ncbi:mannosylfructose- phosphate synthase [Acrasis kona]|uniref:Mannosylfructose- phosphate synthase n=1 Tax=Acrasis kona TaxID=1008807 RepID=A0AAW2ZD24_9EUKA